MQSSVFETLRSEVQEFWNGGGVSKRILEDRVLNCAVLIQCVLKHRISSKSIVEQEPLSERHLKHEHKF